MHGLRHATGFVQSKLAKRLQTRFTPIVQFVLDEGVKKSLEMTRLINEALGSPDETRPRPDDGGSRPRRRAGRRIGGRSDPAEPAQRPGTIPLEGDRHMATTINQAARSPTC